MSGDDILKNCLRLGISAVELRTQPVEVFLGAPVELVESVLQHRQSTYGAVAPIWVNGNELVEAILRRLQFVEAFNHFLHAADHQRKPVVIELVRRVAR